MSDIKIRCSSIGKIMTNPRSGGGLSETTKTYLQELFLQREYNIHKEFWSRYTDKGIACEKSAIILCNEVLDWGLSEEYMEGDRQEHFENEHILGHTDVFTDWLLADVKCSWDGTTFPWFKDKMDNKDYYFQLQGYMWLSGHDTSTLAYCLINTPDTLLNDEIRRKGWELNQIEDNEAIEDYVRSKHMFDHIEKSKRVKAYRIDRDESVIESIIDRIDMCREYYETLKNFNFNTNI